MSNVVASAEPGYVALPLAVAFGASAATTGYDPTAIRNAGYLLWPL